MADRFKYSEVRQKIIDAIRIMLTSMNLFSCANTSFLATDEIRTHSVPGMTLAATRYVTPFSDSISTTSVEPVVEKV